MGTRTLEARLRARLLLLAAPALAVVASIAVGATWRLLDTADSDTARSHAVQLHEMFHRELEENDSPARAIAELRSGIAPTGMRFSVRRNGSEVPADGERVPSTLAKSVAVGGCATGPDEAGRLWRACAVGDPDDAAIVAIGIDRHRATVFHLGEVLGGAVLAVLVALLLSLRSALRSPLSELEALVDWSTRPIETEHPDTPRSETQEIRQLAGAFDALVGRLLDAIARERANNAHIAHELRTPLTALLAELDSVDAGSEVEKAKVERMRADVQRLSHAIEAILLLSSGGERARSDTIVNVADVVRDLVDESVRVEAPDEALVEGDEHLIALAVRNLLENAARHAGGASSLRVVREGDLVRISVIDEGPGLAPEVRERVFERYYRASSGGEGRGLGLAFVSAVAERHGGHAEARPGPGERGLEVSLSIGPIVGWHEPR